MAGNLGGWHAVIVLVVVLLLFGAPKLPLLARSVAQSLRIFKTEMSSSDSGESKTVSRKDSE
jgi:sec-independent protein translocase protein TatA